MPFVMRFARSKSCIVVDDVHLASSGMRDGLRQAPLALVLRFTWQALDRGHLTTEAGTGQLDGLCLGAIERHGGRGSDEKHRAEWCFALICTDLLAGERWERHFIAPWPSEMRRNEAEALHHPDLTGRSLRDVCAPPARLLLELLGCRYEAVPKVDGPGDLGRCASALGELPGQGWQSDPTGAAYVFQASWVDLLGLL